EQIYNKDGSRKFRDREVNELGFSMNDPAMRAEKKLYRALHNYIRQQWNLIQNDPNKRATVGFALTLLRKRMISSIGAIRASLKRRSDGLNNEPLAADANHDAVSAYQAGTLTEGQRERLERQTVVCSAASDEDGLATERRELDKLLKLVNAI